jgi:flavin-dependent dehydrogenase
MLVGAGGHFCPVARALGLRRATDAVVVAQETELAIGEDDARVATRGSVPELYFTPDLDGYGWVFRKQDRVNIGLGRVGSRDLAAHVRAFERFLVDSGRIAAGLPLRWRGHAYLLYGGGRPRPVDDGAVLVGDAAGLAYAASGEGIRPAVESGFLAAEVIGRAAPHFRRDQLLAYARALEDRFGPTSSTVPLPLPASWLAAAGRRLFGTRWFARNVVLDRWFLRAAVPPLPPIGAAS